MTAPSNGVADAGGPARPQGRFHLGGKAAAALAGQAAAQLISVAALAALYRLLAPADFGLLGMAAPWVILLRGVVALGLGAAAVQTPRLEEAQIAGLFWLNIFAGLAAAALVALCGPVLAAMYQTPALVPLCAALAGAPLASAAGALPQALLERELRVAELAAARAGALTLGGLAAVALAWRGGGTWALVAQQYVELLALAIFAWWLTPQRVGWPSAAWRARELARFGGLYSLGNVFATLAQQLDKMLLAWLLGGGETGRALVGMYAQAYNTVMKPVYLTTTPLSGVMLPAFSRAAPKSCAAGGPCAGDKPSTENTEFARLFRGFSFTLAALLFPCGVGLTITAPDVMRLLAGPRWTSAGWVLALLAPSMLAQGHVIAASFALAAAGRVRALCWLSGVSAALVGACAAAGCGLGGLWFNTPLQQALGAAAGFSAAFLFLVFPLTHAAGARAAGLSFKQSLAPLAAPLAWTLAMAAAAGSTRAALVAAEAPWFARLAICVLVGAATYGAFALPALAARRGRRAAP